MKKKKPNHLQLILAEFTTPDLVKMLNKIRKDPDYFIVCITKKKQDPNQLSLEL